MKKIFFLKQKNWNHLDNYYQMIFKKNYLYLDETGNEIDKEDEKYFTLEEIVKNNIIKLKSNNLITPNYITKKKELNNDNSPPIINENKESNNIKKTKNITVQFVYQNMKKQKKVMIQ